MKSIKLLLLCCTVCVSSLNSQLLAPRKATKLNLIVEIGGGTDWMSENSLNAFVSGTTTAQFGKFLVLRGIATHGTKSRFQNLKSPLSNNLFLEAHISPLNKHWGFYGAYDFGVRNYKFENLIQNDAETGASSKQPDPVQYSPDENTTNAVFQYAIPTYRFGYGGYLSGAETAEGAQVNFQFTLFGCYSKAASNLNNVQSIFNLYNLNVPIKYTGKSNLKASKAGFGMLAILQSKNVGCRIEFGKRPTLYKNDQYVSGAEKGLFFHFGLNLRLL